jgi:hypothetical protein
MDLRVHLDALPSVQFQRGAHQTAIGSPRHRDHNLQVPTRSSIAGSGGADSCCRCVFRNNAGSSRSRSRTARVAPRQAAYNCPASLLCNRVSGQILLPYAGSLPRSSAPPVPDTSSSHAPRSRRCAPVASHSQESSSTRPIRRNTQLGLRSKRRASSSSP